MWPTWDEVKLNRYSITQASEHAAAAIRFADFFFTDKGSLYQYIGPLKGSPDTLDIIGGAYLDEKGVLKYEGMPDSMKTTVEYQMAVIAPSNDLVGFHNQQDILGEPVGRKRVLTGGTKVFRDSIDKNVKPYYADVFPNIYMTPEENEKALGISANMSEYVQMMEAKFISGAESLDKLDEYFIELKNLGSDELQKIFEDAYNAYLKRLANK